MASKKGVIEVQFNWIFILIAGGVILLFFVGVVQKQREYSKFKVAEAITSDLRTILSGAKASKETASLIDLPEIEIEYDCSGYFIEKLTSINPHIAFSPRLIKGRALMAWALSWNMPYRVANFLFLTSTDVRYILVKNDGENSAADQINKILPPRAITGENTQKILMNKEVIQEQNLGTVENKNNYKVRFVFFKNSQNQCNGLDDSISLANFADMDNEDVTAVCFEPVNGQFNLNLDSYGKVIFYEKDETHKFKQKGEKSYYLGKPSVIAAIFSDDIETYNCNMKRAFKTLNLATQVYKNRTKDLKEHYLYAESSKCFTLFSQAATSLETIKENSKELSQNFPPQDKNSIQNIYDAITTQNGLANTNNNAQRLSCAEIY